MKTLIAQGADVTAANGEGKTALSLAQEKNHREAAALLGATALRKLTVEAASEVKSETSKRFELSTLALTLTSDRLFHLFSIVTDCRW